MKLIGLVGRKCTGKDTAAAALVDKGYTQIRFADPLKNMMRALLISGGVLHEPFIEGDRKETALSMLCGKSTRFAMQTLGTEWGRKIIGEDVWIQIALSRAAGLPATVISDVRFPNEATAIKAAGGTTIKILRSRPAFNIADDHASESLTDSIETDHTINNNSTIEELRKKILAIEKL